MRDWFKKIFFGGNEGAPELTRGAAAKARGDEFLAQGNWAEAERCYREAVAAAPQLAKAHGNLGFALAQQERNAEAADCLRRALKLDPENADTHYMMGSLAAKQAHRFEEACGCFREALRLAPDFEAAYVALCNLLVLRREPEASRAALADALAHCPACSALHRLQGEVEYDDMQFSAAAAIFERALVMDPANAEACSGLGHALLRLGRRADAMQAFERGIAILRTAAESTEAGDARALFNLGAALTGLGRYDEAQTCFERSLALRPQSSETRIARGWLHLLQGDFEAGWRDYREVMLHSPAQHRFSQPLWDGQGDLSGKAILLYADQGMGDALQLVRYVREIRARGAAAVYLDVQPPLRALLAAMPGVTKVLAQGEPLETFDFHCPMSNLPAAFGTTLETMPDARPYLCAASQATKAWRARMKVEDDGRLRVGVVWAGNPQFGSDRWRSMFLRDLIPLFERGDCLFYLLQKDVRAVDDADLKSLLQERSNVADLAGDLDDFAATAAAVANVDLVLTIDTSVAHLAGAMGKPVWLMLPFAPDFRWLRHRADSPWYPSARMLRQPQMGDWPTVLEAAGKMLDAWRDGVKAA